jgi:hypothetical protein
MTQFVATLDASSPKDFAVDVSSLLASFHHPLSLMWFGFLAPNILRIHVDDLQRPLSLPWLQQQLIKKYPNLTIQPCNQPFTKGCVSIVTYDALTGWIRLPLEEV